MVATLPACLTDYRAAVFSSAGKIISIVDKRRRRHRVHTSATATVVEMARIGDLPEETLLQIFRFLPTSDLQNAVKLVCKKWHRISEDSVLYSRVVIDSKVKRFAALDILKKYSDQVQHVVFKERADLNLMLGYVARCANLKSLKLISCYGQVRNIINLNNEVNVKLIWKVLLKCPSVTSLEIRQTAFKTGLRNFCPANANFHKLRIKADNNMELVEHRFEEMFGIKDLRLQGVKLFDDTALVRICSNNQHSLTVLKLDVWKFDESYHDELMKHIGRCTKLTKLCLENFSASGLTDEGFAHLSNLKKLKTLVITNAKKVSARAIMRLFYEPHVQNFEKLNLGRCPELHQLVLKFVADRCPKLKKLYLDQFALTCRCIGVYDLQYIGENCPLIEHLELNSMDPVVGEAVPSVLKNYPNLKSFKYFVRPLKDYFSEYDPIIRRSKQELPNFHITCTLKHGIIGFKK